MGDLTLYNITNKFVDLMDKVEEGELTEEEYNELGKELALELQKKGSNIIGYTKNIELTINAMKEEEKRISDLRKKLEDKLDKFKEYVKNNMERLQIKKMETELGVLSIVNNPISVEVEDEKQIPKEYIQEVVTQKIDKTAIKNYFKETGEIIPGIKIINDKTSLRIK